MGASPQRTDQHFETGDRVEFEAHFDFTDRWVKGCVSLKRQDPVADVWFWVGYGTTATSAPKVARTEVTLADDKSWIVDLDNVHSRQPLQGQTLRPIHFTYDFSSRERVFSDVPAPFTGTVMVPTDGNSTGGQWKYMGYEVLPPEASVEWCRYEFYALAGYGGTFVHGVVDEGDVPGAFVTEADYPDAVLATGAHWHRDTDSHWIEYTDPHNPWRDHAHTLRNPNAEHYSVFDGPAEAGLRYPWDVGLRWVNVSSAHRFLMQIPGKDKGTFRHQPGSARARGRIIKYATKAMRALKAYGETELLGLVGARASERFAAQVKEWRTKLLQGQIIWPRFNPRGQNIRDGYSPGEVGVWFWGLKSAAGLLDDSGLENHELNFMMDACAGMVFESYWLDGITPHLPYYIRLPDRNHPPQADASGEHFGYLAAMHHQPTSLAEEAKWAAIARMGETLEPRWKGSE